MQKLHQGRTGVENRWNAQSRSQCWAHNRPRPKPTHYWPKQNKPCRNQNKILQNKQTRQFLNRLILAGKFKTVLNESRETRRRSTFLQSKVSKVRRPSSHFLNKKQWYTRRLSSSNIQVQRDRRRYDKNLYICRRYDKNTSYILQICRP